MKISVSLSIFLVCNYLNIPYDRPQIVHRPSYLKSHVQDWTRLCWTVAFRERPLGGRKKTKRFEENKSPKDSPQTVTRQLYFNSHIEDWTATVLLCGLDKSLPKRSMPTRSGHIHHCPSLLGSTDTGEVVLPKTGSNCKAITTDHHLQSQFIAST